MGLRIIALLWGVAEATFFFIVPDVLISFMALEGRARSALTIRWVVFGALLGAVAMFIWAEANPARMLSLLDHVPAVSAGMIEDVRVQLEANGLPAMFKGAISGKPFKLYAAQAGIVGLPLAMVVVVGAAARAFRFVIVGWLVSRLGRAAEGRFSLPQRRMGLAGFWIAFYALYFTVMPN